MTAIAKTKADFPLLRSDAGGIATLTLNRPAQRNALARELMTAMEQEFAALAKDRSIRVVVVAANGPAFSAGHDLKEMRANPGRKFQESLFRQCSRMMLAITRLPQPVIARVHGPAFAAGCQMVATCDLAVAAATATFSTPGVHIGLFCSTPMVALSRAVPRKAAMEMLLTGEAVDAARAYEIGLVSRVVPAEMLDQAITDIARTLLAKSPRVLKIGKEAFYRQIEMGLAEAYDYASQVATENMMLRDAEEGIDAFIAKRPPRWPDP
ncbi:MAG: enoyl-CoA hydratase [Rhodospirillales bacterium]|nr:enoyl-CoA hydratase [Rhodospirillales bacterium]MSP81258.1 enoyl-CoA hydratase [Rhodospirillales bacterium]